jgi:hypothetical protein
LIKSVRVTRLSCSADLRICISHGWSLSFPQIVVVPAEDPDICSEAQFLSATAPGEIVVDEKAGCAPGQAIETESLGPGSCQLCTRMSSKVFFLGKSLVVERFGELKSAAQYRTYLCRVFSLSSARFNSASFCPASPNLPSDVKR